MLPKTSLLKQILAVVLLGVTGAAQAIGCEHMEYAEIKDLSDAQLADKIDTMDQLGKSKSASLEDRAQCSHEALSLSQIRLDRDMRKEEERAASKKTQ